jgi:hypothetical protein
MVSCAAKPQCGLVNTDSSTVAFRVGSIAVGEKTTGAGHVPNVEDNHLCVCTILRLGLSLSLASGQTAPAVGRANLRSAVRLRACRRALASSGGMRIRPAAGPPSRAGRGPPHRRDEVRESGLGSFAPVYVMTARSNEDTDGVSAFFTISVPRPRSGRSRLPQLIDMFDNHEDGMDYACAQVIRCTDGAGFGVVPVRVTRADWADAYPVRRGPSDFEGGL